MSSEFQYEDEDEMSIPPRRPRTMESAPVAEDDEEVAPRPRKVAAAPVAEDDEETPTNGVDPVIHSGWTAGQQVMDAASNYAQALKLSENVQIIKFLDDQPYANYRRHWVERMTQQGRSTRPYTCLETVGRDCPLCAIADRPQAVSAFNVALIGDDGQVILRTWDVGARVFQVLKSYATDPKVGPLSKGFFAVSQTGRKSTTQTNVTPIKPGRLSEDYDIDEPSEDTLRRAGRYDSGIIQIPKRAELEEIAQEMADYE